jgi:hypothetical protein
VTWRTTPIRLPAAWPSAWAVTISVIITRGMKTVTVAEHPELIEPAWELTEDALPEYNSHGEPHCLHQPITGGGLVTDGGVLGNGPDHPRASERITSATCSKAGWRCAWTTAPSASSGLAIAFHMPPGRDAWIIGDEACVVLDFGGVKGYATPG